MIRQTLAASSILFALFSAPASALFIEDFFDSQSLTATSGTVSSTVTRTSPIGVALDRTVELTGIGGQVDFNTQACTGSLVSCGVYSASPGVTGGMKITWDMGGIDVTEGFVNDSLLLNVNLSTAIVDLAVTAISGATSSTHAVANIPSGIAGFPGMSGNLFFTDFTDSGVFTSLDTLIFDFTMNTAATDFEINFLDAVNSGAGGPMVSTPASLALFSLGLMVAGFRARLSV